MDCDTCREALSARMDGEAEPVAPDGHLRSCAACREWQAAAHALTRMSDPLLAGPAPDVAEAALSRVELGSRWWRASRPTRR